MVKGLALLEVLAAWIDPTLVVMAVVVRMRSQPPMGAALWMGLQAVH